MIVSLLDLSDGSEGGADDGLGLHRVSPWEAERIELYRHHGNFLPSEVASNRAAALFSFPDLAAYASYREQSKVDAECAVAFQYAEETRCIISYERSFFRPLLFDGLPPRALKSFGWSMTETGSHSLCDEA